tara:strand:+ start:227 stop:1075 length:849 start_codon:yes stop_codon:yes gene_type:complete
MKTVNSLSGGKTSSYIAKHYPADYNIFALVRTNDKKCIYPDAKIRQIVSDKIGVEFIGTLEMDEIILTMIELEQFIGSKINWLTGDSFDDVIKNHSGKNGVYLPNKMQRFCTTDMKLKPIMEFWNNEINEIVDMRIGFRANEMSRAKTMIEKLNENGYHEDKFIVGKSKNGNNKWKLKEWRIPTFPLIKDAIFKDTIEEYWKDKPVKFAYMNNCVGCFHRNPVLLKHLSTKEENKFNWFMNQETEKARFKTETSYKNIKATKLQFQLFDDDFNECDSGFCGL